MLLHELFAKKLKKRTKIKHLSKENADLQGSPTNAKRGWGSEPWTASTGHAGGISEKKEN